jgi:hypothetical protein
MRHVTSNGKMAEIGELKSGPIWNQAVVSYFNLIYVYICKCYVVWNGRMMEYKGYSSSTGLF